MILCHDYIVLAMPKAYKEEEKIIMHFANVVENQE